MSVKFFKDDDKNFLNPDLLDTLAYDEAQKLTGVNNTKLRQFYHEIKNLEKSLEHQSWEYIKPFVKMVKARVFYAYGRDNSLNPLKNFLSKYLNLIKDERDFQAFSKFFEAVLGFVYGLKEEKNEEKKKNNKRRIK